MKTNTRNEYLKKRYFERRILAIEFLGGKCVKCESTKNLELDHINASSKEFNIGWAWGTNLDRLWKEIEKCQLLCKTCHTKKTIIERGNKIAFGTHGTLSSYRYCHCVVCKKASSEYRKNYRLTHSRKRGQ